MKAKSAIRTLESKVIKSPNQLDLKLIENFNKILWEDKLAKLSNRVNQSFLIKNK